MHSPLERQRRDRREHPPRSEPHNTHHTQPKLISPPTQTTPHSNDSPSVPKIMRLYPPSGQGAYAPEGEGGRGEGTGETRTQTTPYSNHVPTQITPRSACTRYPAVGDAPKKARGRRPHKARAPLSRSLSAADTIRSA